MGKDEMAEEHKNKEKNKNLYFLSLITERLLDINQHRPEKLLFLGTSSLNLLFKSEFLEKNRAYKKTYKKSDIIFSEHPHLDLDLDLDSTPRFNTILGVLKISETLPEATLAQHIQQLSKILTPEGLLLLIIENHQSNLNPQNLAELFLHAPFKNPVLDYERDLLQRFEFKTFCIHAWGAKPKNTLQTKDSEGNIRIGLSIFKKILKTRT